MGHSQSDKRRKAPPNLSYKIQHPEEVHDILTGCSWSCMSDSPAPATTLKNNWYECNAFLNRFYGHYPK